jgi:hypothetical protein
VSRHPGTLCALLVLLFGVDARLQSTAPDKQLLLAAGKGDVAAVADLLAMGADVNATNAYGVTALFMAADKANVELVRLLLQRGADPNPKELQWGKTPLGVASVPWSDVKAEESRAEIVRLLVEKGAGTDGASLVELIRGGHLDAARATIRRGGVYPPYLNLALAAAKRAGKMDLVYLLTQTGAAEPGPLDFARSPERLKALAGLYRSQSGEDWRLTPGRDEDHLLLQRGSGPRTALFPVELTILKSEDLKTVVTFKPAPLPPSEVAVRNAERSLVLTRVSEQ